MQNSLSTGLSTAVNLSVNLPANGKAVDKAPAKRKSLRQYAKEHNVSHETIRKIRAEGINLDEPAAVQARLSEIVPVSAESSPALPRSIPDGSGNKGLAESIKRLQAAELAAFADYQSALAGGEPGAIIRTQKAWVSLTESLRKTELSNPEVEELKSTSVPVAELAAVLGELFRNLRADLEAMPQRLAVECAHKDEISIRESIKGEIRGIISNLHECQYLGGSDAS